MSETPEVPDPAAAAPVTGAAPGAADSPVAPAVAPAVASGAVPAPVPDGAPEAPAAEAGVPFTVPSEYEAALGRVVKLAERELLVFDRDCKEGGWNGVARHAALRDFLLGHRDARFTLIVHETRFIEAHVPRLLMLLREFPHKLAILRTTDESRDLTEGWAIADARHALLRFHFDYCRGEAKLDAPQAARTLRGRFLAVAERPEPGLNATLLGL